ncbi:bacteriohemerythrin [Acetobacterium bakii]|uniref:Hemerythrin n=1 Tax=Acetobacterium bakii TaxID=52689 RepID=A0A0L6TXF4_9FIRM|nr:bacteriohemerythrin [Acetobacterium bakii]KNZ40949.1 hemerythrin [Acetobacterium bakii]
MAITWTPDLSVGVEKIDLQHKMLFEKADQLFSAGKNGKSKDFIAQMLDFLGDYTKQHFHDEETYMASINYPELPAQRKAHNDFMAEVAKLKKDYKESGGNILLIINSNQMVIEWLTKHISLMDKKIGVYAKTL